MGAAIFLVQPVSGFATWTYPRKRRVRPGLQLPLATVPTSIPCRQGRHKASNAATGLYRRDEFNNPSPLAMVIPAIIVQL